MNQIDIANLIIESERTGRRIQEKALWAHGDWHDKYDLYFDIEECVYRLEPINKQRDIEEQTTC